MFGPKLQHPYVAGHVLRQDLTRMRDCNSATCIKGPNSQILATAGYPVTLFLGYLQLQILDLQLEKLGKGDEKV